MPSDGEPRDRVPLCVRRYWWNGHSAWCLKPDGHDSECGEGVVSGRPHVKPDFGPKRKT